MRTIRKSVLILTRQTPRGSEGFFEKSWSKIGSTVGPEYMPVDQPSVNRRRQRRDGGGKLCGHMFDLLLMLLDRLS